MMTFELTTCAVKPSPKGRGYKARRKISKMRFSILEILIYWRFLIFDILFND